MTTAADIGWSEYNNGKVAFEGPFFKGRQHYVRPTNPAEMDGILEVITATEGGCYDSYNGYDGQYGSLGIIQNKEKDTFSLSHLLLASVQCASAPAVETFNTSLRMMGLALDPISRRLGFIPTNTLRSDFNDLEWRVGRPVFCLTADGTKGSWSEAAKEWSKKLAAVLCSLYDDAGARKGQRAMVTSTLFSFAVGDTRDYVHIAIEDGSPWAMTFAAAYLSFAVNNPARAAKHLGLAVEQCGCGFGKAWVIDVLRELTFGPEISIYPARYNAIRPKLEELYGVDLPDFATELKMWQEDTGHVLLGVKAVQSSLLCLGYDLGPSGADGVFGSKSRAALLQFEKDQGLKDPDGMPDPATGAALVRAMEEKGLDPQDSPT